VNLQSTREGVQIAIAALRSDKVRAFLTILGIGIGVATVTGMGAIMNGVEAGIADNFEAIGPANFKMTRVDETQIRFTDDDPFAGKPKITLAEGRMLEELPSVRSATPMAPATADLKVGAKELAGVQVIAMGIDWTTYWQGDFLEGRNFLPSDLERSAPVTVLSEELAKRAFGEAGAVGKQVRMAGNVFEVVGVYKPKPNVFQGGRPIWAIVPATAAFKFLPIYDEWVELWIVPAPGHTQDEAMDEVTMAMRTLRRLKPGDENNFALVRQEAFVNLVGGITGAIRLVMTVLSGIGLIVGGVGVVGIMLISVTERTREIGVRKALGARRSEILWQFLVESTTVTFIGGVFGLLFGAGGALLLKAFTPVPAAVPLSSVLWALAIAAFTGIVFGLYPANKAARLDPVEALRYE
jgi:putative ABC transport system permease protein